MRVFHPPKEAIESAVKMLKQDGIVSDDADFNYEAEEGRRKEIAHRDSDFLYRLSRVPEEALVVDSARQYLADAGLISPTANYDASRFEAFRKEIKLMFKGTWTSITPVMERLMYMLTAVKRPATLVELGSFWGNTLAWFCGPAVGTNPEYTAKRIIGIDIDREITELAEANFARLENVEKVQLIAEDAATALERVEGPIDFLYLEAKDEDDNSGYLDFLRQCYDKVPKGGWVIAHDTTHYDHTKDLTPYLSWVRDKANFSESICFDVDSFGLELSVK